MAQNAFDEHGAIAAGVSLRDAGVTLGRAIDELRELAHGVHPVELSDEGLGAAIEVLADTTPMIIVSLPEQRLAASVEIATYTLVEEAVRRAAVRDDGTVPSVYAQITHSWLIVEVEDPGELSPQSALADLVSVADRVRALEGRLTAQARRDGGVLIRAELPCA